MRAFVAGMLFAAVLAIASGATSVDSKGKWDTKQLWKVVIVEELGYNGDPMNQKFGNRRRECEGFEPFCVDMGKIYLRQRIQ